MKVLVVGSGAREHALVRALQRSPEVSEVLVAPGNGGIAADAQCLPARVDDVPAIVDIAQRNAVDLVVVGPEAPLVRGLVDALAAVGIPAFGPNAAASRLEASKVFSKEFMIRHGIPTAGCKVFEHADEAADYVRAAARPLVVKADGLAAGKGVVVANDATEALEAIDAMMRRRVFGEAGARVVIEERLAGEELSVHVLSDGRTQIDLGAAQDHKRVGEGDTGPNTGGMGAYAPVPLLDRELHARVLHEIVAPTFDGLARDGIEYRGVLFIGIMVDRGVPRVLEYNVRFGDPEATVLLARLDADVAALLYGAATGTLADASVASITDAAIAVVLAAPGYPEAPRTGGTIRGLEEAGKLEGVSVLHAGTRANGAEFITSGGRVLTVTARGANLDEAAARAYAAAARIEFDGMQFRRDIGWRARRTAH